MKIHHCLYMIGFIGANDGSIRRSFRNEFWTRFRDSALDFF